MSKPAATQFAESLETVLKRITQANGYHTDLGQSVHRGFWAHVIKARDAVFPAVVIHPGSEQVERTQGGGKSAIVNFNVPLVIAVGITYDAKAYEQLQACAADLRLALYSAREEIAPVAWGDTFKVGDVVPDLSPDSKFALASLAVGISIVETYST